MNSFFEHHKDSIRWHYRCFDRILLNGLIQPFQQPERVVGFFYHQLEHRVEAHIFVAFLAYCLHVTLRAKLKPLAPGLTPRAVLDKLAAVQMLDVHFPTTDGRTLILSRYTELNADQKLLVKRLKLDMPSQPPPRITAPVGQPARAAIQHV